MKNLCTLSIVFLVSISSIFAQSETCDCKTDLDFIVSKMKKMPSYKDQIKGEKAIEFKDTYKTLSEKMKQPILIEDCYKLLLQQMLLVNDVHASLTFKKEYLSKEDVKDSIKIAAFKTLDIFKNHPKTNKNISVLKDELSKKSTEDLEGIYNYGELQKIGVYYLDNKKDLIGVVLESKLNQWETGEIIFYATQTSGIKYNLYYYNPTTRKPGLVKSISFENGRIWGYKKEGNSYNAELPIKNQSNLVFKQINENTQYMYFGDFNSFSKKNRNAFKSFYNKMKKELNAENVIVDLRSNGGGNKKLSDPFLKLLKKKNVYILTNCFAGSNGEQFTLKLRNLKNGKHLGQTTRGIISYGMNYGYNYNTPSGNFNIKPTDMDFSKYLRYEGKGVVPQIKLDFNRDWIEQTLEIIAKDNQ